MRYVTIALIGAALVTTSLEAQEVVPSSISWQKYTMPTTSLKEPRTYFVSTPVGYSATSKAMYPVLVILDADDQPQFEAALANVRFLSNRGEAPSLIVVGIVNGKDRTHDMTPAATGETAKELPTAGGVSQFLAFIQDEVLAAVRKWDPLESTCRHASLSIL